jgi:hypothetical protein
MRISSLLPAILAIALAIPAPAQIGPLLQPGDGEVASPPPPEVEGFETEAAAIIGYDDGEVDTYLHGAPGVRTFELAMRFDGIGGTDVIRFEVVIWAANGPGGSPGTELAHFAAVATGVTATPAFYHAGFSYPLTTSTVYVGVRNFPAADPDFMFCLDNDGATVHPGYVRIEELGAWNPVSGIDAAYNAFMLRAYVSTPGVFLESLLVPSFLVDTLSPGGTTTLFAVRNLTDATVSADVRYFDTDGTSLRDDEITLDPDETHTVNIRDVAGLPADFDGYARGYVEISTAGDPHQVPVLAGDFFQVDVADNFATGDKLVRRFSDLCTVSSIRFLTFPFAGSGTRLAVWIVTPRGSGLGDPPSFTVQVFDEAGNPQGAPIGVLTAEKSLELQASDFAGGLPFGVLRFDFTGSNGGVAYSEAQAGGRFSVGMTGQCHEAP